MIEILSLIHLFVVLIVSVRILAREDISGAARLAWFIVIVSLPFAGLGIYLVLGEIYISRVLVQKHKAHFKQFRELPASIIGKLTHLDDHVEPLHQPAFRYAASINGFKPTLGNRSELMKDADETTLRLLQDIKNAQDHVHLLYYIWLPDVSGTQMVEAVIEAAERGVICRVMVDAIGSKLFLKSALWKRLKASKVQTTIAMPFKSFIATRVLNRYDLRNHRKKFSN